MDQPSSEQLLNIAVAHPHQETAQLIQRALEAHGHTLIGPCSSSQELLRLVDQHSVNLVIAAVELEEGNVLDTLIEIADSKPTPAIVTTREASLEHVRKALQDHVMAYLVEPVDQEELLATIFLVQERYRQFEQMRQEAESLRSALEDRKLVERAKGILMVIESLSEDEAHRLLQKRAKDGRLKLRQIASEIITAHERSVQA